MVLLIKDTACRQVHPGPLHHTFAAAMFPSWAFLPVSRFVLAFSTVTGICIVAHAVVSAAGPLLNFQAY